MITSSGNKKDLRNMGFKGVSMRLAGECAGHTFLAAHTVTLLISESAHVSKSFFCQKTSKSLNPRQNQTNIGLLFVY